MTFTYSGPSVAAAFVAGVFNDAESRAQDKANEAADEFTTARGVVAQAPDSLAAGRNTAPTITPADIDIGLLLARQQALDDQAQSRPDDLSLASLVDDIDSFMASYFPGVEAGVAAARLALAELMAGSNFAGGRELARLRLSQVEEKQFLDFDQKEDELLRSYANRNFPLPPGELVHAIALLRTAQLQELGDTAFEFDAAEMAREREHLERTMRLLVSNRAEAIKTFSAYLAAACLARYDQKMAETEAANRTTQMLSDQLAQMLTAQNKAAALQVRAGEIDHGLSRQYLTALDKLAEQQANGQLQAALAMAKVLGAQAATAYNNMRGSVGITGSEEMNEL